jgi:hypothetical protein
MIRLIVVCAAMAALSAVAFAEAPKAKDKQSGEMQQYVIERQIEGAGQMSADELRSISQRSRTVLEGMGDGIEWVHSYVADDTVYCVYKAEDPELIRQHAEQGGFPVDRIAPVSAVIDLTTAD